MWRNKFLRRAGLPGLIVIAVIVAGTTFSTSLISACGCGSINGWVIEDLKGLDAKINDYANTHSGLFPSYDEAVQLYKAVDPDVYAPQMTPNIDVVTGSLNFTPTDKAIVYAVSADRHSYILRGVGVSRRYAHVHFFGWDLGDHNIGVVYPILKSSDPEPHD